MKPPNCPLCSRSLRSDSASNFGQVRFADFEPMKGPGHPKGLVWFCVDHLDAAKKLAHLPSTEAIRKMRDVR